MDIWITVLKDRLFTIYYILNFEPCECECATFKKKIKKTQPNFSYNGGRPLKDASILTDGSNKDKEHPSPGPKEKRKT